MAKKRPTKRAMELGIIAYITAVMALNNSEADTEDWQTRIAAAKDVIGSVLKGLLNDYVKYFGPKAAMEMFGYKPETLEEPASEATTS